MKDYRKNYFYLTACMLLLFFTLSGCKTVEKVTNMSEEKMTIVNESTTEEHDLKSDDSEVASPKDVAGFEEFDIGDSVEKGPLHIAAVYFQPVDMEPEGNSLAKADADAHIEADITAMQEGAEMLGYGKDEFVPGLGVKAIIQKEGSDVVQEVAFMPMNASDGPHYGSNVKFEEGLGTYKVKFVISAPGNEYLLHVDKETGVNGKFWTTPIETEWLFDWEGPKW